MPNRKQRYKDMEKYKETRSLQRKRYYERSAIYKARKWTHEECQAVIEHEIPDSKLSLIIERSIASIQKKRMRLSKNGMSEED